MKKLILFALVSVLVIGNGNAQEKTETIKVISYNIWNGFDWGKDEDRRSELVGWMKAQAPDIVGLQELCNYSDEKLAEDAKGWGHEHSILLKKSGYSVGLTSKYPIQVVERIRDNMHHGALHCRTQGIDVFVVHFSPFSYKRRREETAIIMKKLKAVASTTTKFLVMGDFNAHSPYDADLYKNNVVRDRTRKSDANKGDAGNLANGEIDYSILNTFLGFPLIDLCQRYTNGMDERGSFPGRPLGEINKESDEELVKRLERIDFILVSEELGKNAVDGRVYNGEANWYLSDHYPVGVEFKTNK